MLPPISSNALVVHCSDHRFQRAFRELIEEKLKIGDHDVIAVPGGPQFLAALEYLPKLAWAGTRWTKFLVQMHGLKRIVLIAHDECAWYRQVHGTHAEIESRQRADLARADEQLQHLLPGVNVEAYFVSLDSGTASFQRVDPAAVARP